MVEKLMEVYTLEELLEYNDMTSEEAILKLFEDGHIKLPDIKPLD